MGACWMVVLLLGCRFSQATQSHNPMPHVEVKTICASARKNVSLECHNVTSAHMNFFLLKGEEIISNITCKQEKGVLRCTQPHNRVGMETRDNTNVKFVLTAVNESSLGVYRCEGTTIYPPPLVPVPSTLTILVAEHNCTCSKSCSHPGDRRGNNYELVWILVVSLLGLYSIIATITAINYWVKSRNVESQCDYMNTKPRPSKERKKKRGVQNPFPRFM